jgi:diguanylate cyclase (GGDEF)-like protein
MHDKFIRGILDSISSRIAILDREGHVMEVNKAWKQFAHKNGPVGINKIGIGDNYINVCQNAKGNFAESAQEAAEGIRNVLSGAAAAFSLEYPFTSETGVEWFLMHATPLEGKDGGAVVTHTNITELKKMEEKLHTLSIADSLTGLYNRRGFFIMADKQVKMARRMKRALLLLSVDLDGLKEINDRFGHQEGDLALVATANILKATYRESDIIARIGGDEFVVVQIGADQKNVEVTTARLQENIERHNVIGNRSYSLSISFGMSWYHRESPRSIDELLANADKMMYEQKRLKAKF